MLHFTKKHFKSVFNVILWLYFISIVISATVGGVIIGDMMGGYKVDYSTLGGILGFIIGVISGLLSTILLGGLISTFITMADDIRWLKESTNKESINNAIENIVVKNDIIKDPNKYVFTCEICKSEVDENDIVCPKCGAKFDE